jgi:M6 family metalloprotease-like protein
MNTISILIIVLAICLAVDANKSLKRYGHKRQTSSQSDACKLTRDSTNYWTAPMAFPRSPNRPKTTGTLNIAVLFVDFNDSPATQRVADVLQILALDTTAAQYYRNESYNQLQLKFLVHAQWLRMPKNSAAYNMRTSISYADHKSYISDAVDLGINAGATSYLNSADALLVITNPNTKNIGYGPAFCPEQGYGLYVSKLNKWFYNAVTSGADLNSWLGYWYPHEFGHNMGLPDLYKLGFSGDWRMQFGYTGDWSLMGHINGVTRELFGWERWFLNWLQDAQIECAPLSTVSSSGKQYSLSPIADGGSMHLRKLLVVKLSAYVAIGVEFRKAIGADVGIKKPGVLVYVVDTSVSITGPIRVLPLNENDGYKWNAALGVGESISYKGVNVKFVGTAIQSSGLKGPAPVTVAQVVVKLG